MSKTKGATRRATEARNDLITWATDDYHRSGLMEADWLALEPVERINACIRLKALVTPRQTQMHIEQRQYTIEDRLNGLVPDDDDT